MVGSGSMKICVFGAGAIGGYIAAEMALAGYDVCAIARGKHLDAIRENGLRLIIDGAERVAHLAVSDNPADFGPQDYVICALKAHQSHRYAELFEPLLGIDSAVVTAMNGIPWWYFHGLDGPLKDRQLKSVDPGGQQWEKIGPERAIGCVVYPATEVVEPGVIQHLEGDRFSLGEPSGEKTERVVKLSEILRKAGFKAPVRPRIRNDIWVKLWGNLTFNPISTLTHATLDVIATEDGTRSIARGMMLEAQAIGEKLGVRFGVDVEQRIAGAAAVGAHKTSMLQDLERGRPMEIDALVSVIQEMGRLVEVETFYFIKV